MAIFDDIARLEQSSGRNRSRNCKVTRTVEPTIYPVTASDVIAHLKLPSGSSETNLTRIIQAITESIEKHTNRGYMKQTIRQVHDSIGSRIILRVRPVLEVSAFQYISSTTDNTLEDWASTNYLLSLDNEEIVPVSGWPSHRGFSSVVVTYNVGYNDLPDSPTDEQKATARAAVPSDIREAALQWIGHLYKNREGQSGELKYEVVAKQIGVIPSNVAGLLEGYMDRRLSFS